MPENPKFIPTKVIDFKKKPDGSEIMTFECGTPYQDENWTIPGSELAIRRLGTGWSIPNITCNHFDPEIRKCKMRNFLLPVNPDSNPQKGDLKDCTWSKSL